MISRSLSVAKVTFLEFLTLKIFFILLVVFLCQVIGIYLMRESTFLAQVKSLQEVTIYGMNIFVLIAVLSLASGVFTRDFDRKNSYLLAVKPLRSWELLFGKTLGVSSILFVFGGFVFLLTIGCLSFISKNEKQSNVRSHITLKEKHIDLKLKTDGYLWHLNEQDKKELTNGGDLVVDLRRFYPGLSYEIEIFFGNEIRKVFLETQKKYRFSFSFPPEKIPESLKLSLLRSNREQSLRLSEKRLWIEGRNYSVQGNFFRGLTVTLSYLLITSFVTLVISILVSQPTAILFGFTFFLAGQYLSNLEELPNIVFSNKKIIHHGSHVHEHEEERSHSDESFYKEMSETILKGFRIILPPFENLSPNKYFNQHQWIPKSHLFSQFFELLPVCITTFFVGLLFLRFRKNLT